MKKHTQTTPHPIRPRRGARLGFLGLAALGLGFAACGGGGGGSGSSGSQGGFQLVSISVPEGAVWKINRAIDFVFNQDVDFSTVNLNTISISTTAGLPVTGSFSLLANDARTVRFQPTCPTLADLSDAGLQPGAVPYTIRVLGGSAATGLTVESVNGAELSNSQQRNFITPNSTLVGQIFFDVVAGPSSPVLHTTSSAFTDPGTHLEAGGDSSAKTFFVFNPLTQQISQPQNQGINLFSAPGTALAVVLEINQPVNPAAENISSDRIKLQALNPNGNVWTDITATVELVANCTDSGATLRVEPIGILPQGADLRVVITTSFEDIVGERNSQDLDAFARFGTFVFNDPTLNPSDDLADELFEPFDVGGSGPDSFEDVQAAFAEPKADWGAGNLQAAFDFTGTGGFDGAFDWVIPAGTTISLNTSGSQQITGGNLGANPETGLFTPSKTQTITGGLVNVRHLRIDAGATLRVTGSNPLVLQATGKIIINGLFDISGVDSKDVATLDTGNQPEPGGVGTAGGGTGGTGSFLTATSTPQGGNGFGAFNVPNLGGRGGESGFDPGATNNVANRRPGGGGGGAFGADEPGTPPAGSTTQTNLLVANPGRPGSVNARGALDDGIPNNPPQGGLPGPRPFFDGVAANDFFGTRFNQTTGEITLGELTQPWAGSGGGAGGDACLGPTFPTPMWTFSSDEKGGGGGGGAGSMLLQALDDIVFGAAGRITCNGGRGASGENTNFLDRVGGGGGGGSGGHVILQAGDKINFLAVPAANQDSISARGGKYGLGDGAFPPGNTEQDATNAGGQGGAGIIQLHTLSGSVGTNPALNDILVNGTLAARTAPDPFVLVPTFGSRSRARSEFIPVGDAAFNPVGGVDAIQFHFDGTDPLTGLVLDVAPADGVVDDLAPILGPTTVNPSPNPPFITATQRTIVVDASSLNGTFDDIYLRNPNLLKAFKLRLSSAGAPSVLKDFDVASATYAAPLLSITIDAAGPAFNSFFSADTQYSLIPRFFRVRTNNTLDLLPTTSTLAISFQAVGQLANGDPNADAPLVDWTTDITDFNVPIALGNLKFVRFEVLFDLDALNSGLTVNTPRPALDFLRVPFRF